MSVRPLRGVAVHHRRLPRPQRPRREGHPRVGQRQDTLHGGDDVDDVVVDGDVVVVIDGDDDVIIDDV